MTISLIIRLTIENRHFIVSPLPKDKSCDLNILSFSLRFGALTLLMTTNQGSCAIPVKQLCQRSDTTVPTRWHNCAKPLAQPFPIEETTVPSEETTIP